ncbi:MAG: hybrid sensor histidine kinase/response regulator [Candidatus Andeanibacterium colombiense]|uniref:histidine kinase n=1 Tax=Candidatus Andeanibacterium colombiense TaxID=3121345 RepID=A0AAJ5X4Q5_9SPHN|nr:MAG: hybrid sensor histidine kinase/response regulator [Sphingomonadaceae bacterium]
MPMNEPVPFLLVDDLDENLVALEALLRRDGLVCHKARSGEEALELLLKGDFALALLDVQMPGMNGYELAEFMRSSERARHVPIIFLTAGTADAQRRFRGYEAGAVDFIQKPVEADVLRSKAEVFFDLYRQRQQIISQRDELEGLARALRTSDRRKNEFLAMLGHELRNPVAALGAGLDLLARRKDPDHAEVLRQEMGQNVQHLARLVEDLIDIARIDQGKILLKKERVKLQEVLEFAARLAAHDIAAARHELTLDITEEPIWLDADYARVAQIINNLLGNAVKYSPPGQKIGLSVRSAGSSVAIEVSDTGIGIPEDRQAEIFELFAQVEGANGKTEEGLGIGLALVRQLVELHGGTITLKSSAPGKGSVFEVCLPTSS